MTTILEDEQAATDMDEYDEMIAARAVEYQEALVKLAESHKEMMTVAFDMLARMDQYGISTTYVPRVMCKKTYLAREAAITLEQIGLCDGPSEAVHDENLARIDMECNSIYIIDLADEFNYWDEQGGVAQS